MGIPAEPIPDSPNAQPWGTSKKRKHEDDGQDGRGSQRVRLDSNTSSPEQAGRDQVQLQILRLVRQRDTPGDLDQVLDELLTQMEEASNRVPGGRYGRVITPIRRSSDQAQPAGDLDSELETVALVSWTQAPAVQEPHEGLLTLNASAVDTAEEREQERRAKQDRAIQLLDPSIRARFPAAQFNHMSAHERVERGRYHVKLEDLKHAIEDNTSDLIQSASALVSDILDKLRQSMLASVAKWDNNEADVEPYQETIQLAMKWDTQFMDVLGGIHTGDERMLKQLVEPFLEWMFAQAGTFFLQGPDCIQPIWFPEYFENSASRENLIDELQAYAGYQKAVVVRYIQQQA